MSKIFSDYEFDYNQYKKRTSHKNGLAFSILFILIILLTGVAVYFKPIKTSDYEFYFVKVNSFSTYTQANSLATEIQNSGGAGYVYLDKKYHVLVNFYQNQKDAENVAENLKDDYPNVEVFTISAKKIKNLPKISKNQSKSIENLSNFTINSIKSLSDLSVKFDKKELNFSQLTTKFTSIYDDYSNLNNEFLNQFKTDSKFNVSREYACNIKSNLKEMSSLNQENINPQFKYLLVDSVINYCSFLDSF